MINLRENLKTIEEHKTKQQKQRDLLMKLMNSRTSSMTKVGENTSKANYL